MLNDKDWGVANNKFDFVSFMIYYTENYFVRPRLFAGKNLSSKRDLGGYDGC